jgi:hypothetical protein
MAAISVRKVDPSYDASRGRVSVSKAYSPRNVSDWEWQREEDETVICSRGEALRQGFVNGPDVQLGSAILVF